MDSCRRDNTRRLRPNHAPRVRPPAAAPGRARAATDWRSAPQRAKPPFHADMAKSPACAVSMSSPYPQKEQKAIHQQSQFGDFGRQAQAAQSAMRSVAGVVRARNSSRSKPQSSVRQAGRRRARRQATGRGHACPLEPLVKMRRPAENPAAPPQRPARFHRDSRAAKAAAVMTAATIGAPDRRQTSASSSMPRAKAAFSVKSDGASG